MQFIWTACLFIIFYTFLAHPIILYFFSILFKKNIEKSDFTPSVSLIIAAYNEEKSIESKIINSLKLNYPKEKLEILIGSDCSTDKTDEIVKKYQPERIRLIRGHERGGKTAIQNYVVQKCTKEIIVFSDATSIYDKNAIYFLVRNFADPNVGCVGGRLIFNGNNPSLATSKNLIENFDQKIKIFQTRVHSILGVDGCIYAVRKKLYENLDQTLTSDFVEPLKIIKKGYRTVYEPEAICHEETTQDKKSEFLRKIRTVRAGLFGFFNVGELLNPIRFPFISFELISHKFLRWCTPFLLIILFISNIILANVFIFQLTLFLQVTFYLAAIVFRKNDKKILRTPFHFCLLNLAALKGWLEFIKGKKTEIWETDRKAASAKMQKKKMSNPSAVILGLCPTGLAAVRELGKAGVKIFGYDKNKFSVGYFSKYCQKLKNIKNNDPREILEALIKFAKEQATKPILLSTSDEYLEFVSQYAEQLKNYFSFNQLTPHQLDLFINKKKFYQLCSELGLPHPRTFTINKEKDIYNIAAIVNYPAIIKPTYSHIWARKYGTKKVFVVHDQSELITKYNQLGNMKNNVFIQEITPGSDELIFFFAAYFDEEAKPHQVFTGKKLRQFPPGFGTTVLAKSIKVEKIEKMTTMLMQHIGYSGLCDIEFKYDIRDCQYKIIEVNPRIGRWYSLTTASNKKIVLCAYSHLSSSYQHLQDKDMIQNVIWLFFYRDIFSSFAMWKEGKLKILEWFRSIRNCDVDAVIEKEDFIPTFGYLLEMFAKIMQMTIYRHRAK